MTGQIFRINFATAGLGWLVLFAIPFGAVAQELGESEIPERNERVLRMLKEVEPSIRKARYQNHEAATQLLIAYLDAGDYESALSYLIQHKNRFTYPIQDGAYHLAKAGYLGTSLRLIRDYYAAEGIDIWTSEFSPALQDRFRGAIDKFAIAEVVGLIHKFKNTAGRRDLLKIGIYRALRSSRLDLAKRLAQEPEAEESLYHWAGSFGQALARNKELVAARELAKKTTAAMQQYAPSSREFKRSAESVSQILSAIAIYKANHPDEPLENKTTVAEDFAAAHSFHPIPVAKLMNANQVELAIDFYRAFHRALPENDDNMAAMFGIRDTDRYLDHPLARGATKTDDVDLRVQLLSAIEFREFQVPGITNTLKWVQTELVKEKNPQRIAKLESARQNLTAIAIEALSEIENEWARRQIFGPLTMFLADNDEPALAIEVYEKHGAQQKGGYHNVHLLMRCAAGAIRHGRLEEGFSYFEQWDQKTTPHLVGILARELAKAKLIEYLPDVLEKIKDVGDRHAVLETVLEELRTHYPWQSNWEFAQEQFGDNFQPALGVRIFLSVAEHDSELQVQTAYQWMREHNVDGYHYLLDGLRKSGKMNLACELTIDLLNDPPPQKIIHGFPEWKLLVKSMLANSDYRNAWKLTWTMNPNGSVESLRAIFVALLKSDKADLVAQFIEESESMMNGNAAKRSMRKAVVKLAHAQAILLEQK